MTAPTLKWLAGVLVVCCGLAVAAQRPGPMPLLLKGTVVDPSGAPVSSALVRLVHVEGGQEGSLVAKTTSTQSGTFRLQTSSVGAHHLVVEAKGLRTVTVSVELTPEKSEVDMGQIRLGVDCSAEGAMCDDFGLSAPQRRQP